MLTEAENELLTRVGPGTPMGELMRRYWQPIAAAVQLDEEPVRKIRLLGEDLTLYRSKDGSYGLVGDKCPHRRVWRFRWSRNCWPSTRQDRNASRW